MSTLRPKCYKHYSHAEELIDFLKTTVEIYQSLPTFQFLEACGIVPSNDATYALADVEGCLQEADKGYLPHIGCSPVGELNEVWYYFYGRGRIREGAFEIIGTDSSFPATCPITGIKYLPKTPED